MKTSELTSPALDWAVAKCEGALEPEGNVRIVDLRPVICVGNDPDYEGSRVEYQPSYDWSQGGPIIERESMDVEVTPPSTYGKCYDVWRAWHHNPETDATCECGPTPLIAAMRCYVASRWSGKVEIPEELI